MTFLTGFALMTAMTTGASSADSGELLLSEEFNRPNGLITNEYAYWNPDEPDAVTSLFWELDSGSFFAEGRAGWTGVPDDVTPNATSTNGTNSAVFRLSTKRADFTNVTVSFSLLNQGLSSSPSTPPVDWDGLHIWLRYQNEYNLYYASINRRDNTVVVKKKVPGGSSNGGTYYQLSSSVRYVVPYNMWQEVTATVNDNKDGSVTIRLYSGKNMLVEATDDGSLGGPPLRGSGKVGLRGDNANLKFKNFRVTALPGTGLPGTGVAETPEIRLSKPETKPTPAP